MSDIANQIADGMRDYWAMLDSVNTAKATECRRVECKACNGIGSYSFPEGSAAGGDGWFDCPDCAGSGYVVERKAVTP